MKAARLAATFLTAACLMTPLNAWAQPAAPPAATGAETHEETYEETYLPPPSTAREDLLGLHQGLALGALAGLAATAVLGQVLTHQKLNSPNPEAWQAAHVASAVLTSTLYAGAATTALMAPPPRVTAAPAEGFDPMVWHRGMSWLHGVGLGATVALGLITLLQDPQLKTAHQVLGWTTTGLMAVSGGLIVFNF